MTAKHSHILSQGPYIIVRPEVTYYNRGREGGLTPLFQAWTNKIPRCASTGISGGLTPRILVPVALLALSMASTSRADQRRSSTMQQQQQSATCPLHQDQQSESCPMHQQHGSQNGNAANEDTQQARDQSQGQSVQRSAGHNDHDAMNQRGNAGMGFDQEKTIHHFRLLTQGGAIEVEAKNANDTISRDQIRAHLGHIAQMFSAGNFSIPMFVHDQTPPGVEIMKELKEAISYEYQKTDRGGRVAISTKDPQAIEAIHSFLRFQIREHKTGDSLEPLKPGAAQTRSRSNHDRVGLAIPLRV